MQGEGPGFVLSADSGGRHYCPRGVDEQEAQGASDLPKAVWLVRAGTQVDLNLLLLTPPSLALQTPHRYRLQEGTREAYGATGLEAQALADP